ncbi:MAG TPA: peroxide stress protein YaaA [Acidimicrobiales bacterium]|nr:peroxide stress protein YaaA [Acidimicrobiales bacterium]
MPAERAPAILLPPSEGKAPGGRGRPWRPGTGVLPELDGARATVLAALGDGVDGRPTRPAVERYTGVLYRELDWASLPAPAKALGSRTVLIASGLWGVSAPRDPLPDYRLKMGASLPPLGRLSAWWRPRLTAALAGRLAGRVVWDLLPHEHAAAWLPGDVPARRRVTVRFVDREGRTVSHWNKLLKGALVRHLLIERPAGPEDLAAWEHPSGYRVDPARCRLDGDPALLVLSEVPAPHAPAGGQSGSGTSKPTGSPQRLR